MTQVPALERERFTAAHAHMLADRSIQHALPDAVSPVVPAWIKMLANMIRAAWPLLRILAWVALAAGALALLWVVARHLVALHRPRSQRVDTTDDAPPEWQPNATAARGLLREADALAGMGRYAEAARLVLHRSIEDIERRCPTLVRASTTSRDLSALGALPDTARPAFAAIASIVERSLFADHSADHAAWCEARDAYARFARVTQW